MYRRKYIVIVDDNFNFMDEDERYNVGEYDNYEEAVTTCKTIVDKYLSSAIKPNMTANELFSSFITFGEDPFIIGNTTDQFSAWGYAKQKCEELTSR